jgi:hypothetical protein
MLAMKLPALSCVSMDPAITTRIARTPTAPAKQVLSSQRKRPLRLLSAWSLT